MKKVYLFPIGGQSNAEGQGSASASPTVPTGKVLQFNNGVITDANDPVGSANTGSAWPAFGTTYHQTTGRTILFVPTAVAGSAQIAAADNGNGNWDVGGTLFDTSVALIDAAFLAAVIAGYTPVLGGLLWGQGETEADGINTGKPGVTQATYTAGFQAMRARYRAHYGAEMPVYLFATGTKVGASDVGYAAIRAAQRALCAQDAYTSVVFDAAVGFPGRGLMNADQYHYLQSGYVEMGQVGASTVVSGPALSLQAPTVPIVFDETAFTADVGTWELIAGSVTTLDYTLTGHRMHVDFILDETHVSGTPSILQLRIPAGRVAAHRIVFSYWYYNGAWTVGYGFIAAGSSVISFQRDPPGTAFTAATLVYCYGAVDFPIL